MSATSAHSAGFSEMCVWIGRLSCLASAPSAASRGSEHEGAKRGVMMGEINVLVGSRRAMCAMVARVASRAAAADASR